MPTAMSHRPRPVGVADALPTGSTPSASRPDPALVAESRRQHALQHLSAFEYPVELRTLATYAAAVECDTPVDAAPDRAVERAAIALHHVDLPELVAAGLVDYDPESRMAVRAGDATSLAGAPQSAHRD